MNLSSFKESVAEKKRDYSFWFDDESDVDATNETIRMAEKELGVVLPQKYKEFVTEYGGGFFAFTNVFSIDLDSNWNILRRNKEAEPYLPERFIAISDDETGGLFGFLVDEGQCSDNITEKLYSDIFEYVISVGLTK